MHPQSPSASSAPPRRIQRIRHELRFREVVVDRVERPTPGFARVTFSGTSLADFRSDGFDDHVKFVFDDEDGTRVRRDYTPRHYDAARGELTLEFALHDDGPAGRWARRAQAGQTVTIAGPKGSMCVPTDYDWHLLVGDASALPAIHRRIEEMPAHSRVLAVIQAPTADRRHLHSAAALTLLWVADADALIDAVQALARPEGDGFAWGAGEASAMARLRDVLTRQWQLPREAMRVSSYWRIGQADFSEKA
ncbi:siderophore-interacting protein [Denitromonas iodatirespirans]|uniref:Siderophore-interacting protein n=1 Tax=Denitromonas iodatirespirans TaxID=2795389 RepID=A0A944D4R7_DENI1|nr:siderophore-interacting protein [Denitromonas iodatirespirans]MBT0959985.1 siderophore-interacting protein [Denitromonas iodatirespirans]